MGKKSKAEKALKAREAELRAELERRAAAKAAKKSKSKGKKKKGSGKKAAPVETVDVSALGVMTIEAEGFIDQGTPDETAPETPGEVAERAKPLKGKALKAAMTADVEKGKARKKADAARLAARLDTVSAEAATPSTDVPAETDDEIRARVQAKRAERDARLAEMQATAETVGQVGKARKKAKTIEPTEGDHVLGTREKSTAEKKKGAAVETVPEHVAEIIETDHGREIAVGVDKGEDLVVPSEGVGPVLEEGRNGYKIIQLDADGKPDPRKVRQMTRVTTFVGNIDDETTLRAWERRLLAEGLAGAADEYAPRILDLRHRYDVTIAKARKADRKGKLDIGELATIEEKASKEYKDALNAIVDEALDAAGRHDAAEKGTDLHALTELRDAEGIDAVRAKYDAGEISKTDLASIEAYDDIMRAIGAKTFVAEAVVVNDEMGYAGRLDRIYMAKLPELRIKTASGEYVRPADQRARRYIGDVKTGRIDYGAGKISRQLAAYGMADLYDTETGERTRHSAARDIALVVHVPQGAGVAHVYPVDIKAGAAHVRLSGDVRRARNAGRKAIDMSAEILAGEPGE